MVGTPRCGVCERPFISQIATRGRCSAPSLPWNPVGLISNVPSAQFTLRERFKYFLFRGRLQDVTVRTILPLRVVGNANACRGFCEIVGSMPKLNIRSK